jgi:3-deoxy-D-manno-octulosonate 8-phosphate phosphatase (KDO 8-P phosphatase)
MNKIELVILDIDGVMTDGTKIYGIDGLPFAKRYCDKDFTAIKRLKGSGINVCFLSGDENVNKAMAINRNIDFYSARGLDKADFVSKFEEIYNTTQDKMLYVGDDLFDLSIMKKVGFSFCPKDSTKKVRDFCYPNIIDRNGGENVVSEMVDFLIENKFVSECEFEEIEKLDKKEIF